MTRKQIYEGSRRSGNAAPPEHGRMSRLRLPQLRRRQDLGQGKFQGQETSPKKPKHAASRDRTDEQGVQRPSAKLPGEHEPARRYDTQALQGQKAPAGPGAEPTPPDVRQVQTPLFSPEEPTEIDRVLEEGRRGVASGGKVSGEQDEGDQGC